MLFRKTERSAENELEIPACFLGKFLHHNGFRYSIVCQTEFAAAEPAGVIPQPRFRIEVAGIKHRDPFPVLESACSHDDHRYRIGEEKVKIKQKDDLKCSKSTNL
jgi:hypothetical protein